MFAYRARAQEVCNATRPLMQRGHQGNQQGIAVAHDIAPGLRVVKAQAHVPALQAGVVHIARSSGTAAQQKRWWELWPRGGERDSFSSPPSTSVPCIDMLVEGTGLGLCRSSSIHVEIAGVPCRSRVISCHDRSASFQGHALAELQQSRIKYWLSQRMERWGVVLLPTSDPSPTSMHLEVQAPATSLVKVHSDDKSCTQVILSLTTDFASISTAASVVPPTVGVISAWPRTVALLLASLMPKVEAEGVAWWPTSWRSDSRQAAATGDVSHGMRFCNLNALGAGSFARTAAGAVANFHRFDRVPHFGHGGPASSFGADVPGWSWWQNWHGGRTREAFHRIGIITVLVIVHAAQHLGHTSSATDQAHAARLVHEAHATGQKVMCMVLALPGHEVADLLPELAAVFGQAAVFLEVFVWEVEQSPSIPYSLPQSSRQAALNTILKVAIAKRTNVFLPYARL